MVLSLQNLIQFSGCVKVTNPRLLGAAAVLGLAAAAEPSIS
jgi:hypothetical protein